MEVSINELSFKGQFKSFEEVELCINTIALVSMASKELTGFNPIRRTKDLSKRQLINDKTIEEFKYELFQSKDPRDAKLLTTLLVNIVQGPFIQSSELNEDFKNTQSICGEIIEGTSIHSYLSKEEDSINAVISAYNSGYDACDIFTIKVDDKKKSTIINLFNDTCCHAYTRFYEPNPKHAILNDKLVGGEIHSKMDLDDSTAQKCLNNGMQIIGDRYVYAYVNDKWYEFPLHRDGKYHGYPIGNQGNLANINRIKRVFGAPPYKNTGYKFCTK